MKKILLAISIFINLTVFNLAYADDTTPPVITVPGDQTFTSTSFPATPSLVVATATDDTDLNPVITYDPVSFPVGATTVTWTARDASGNTSTATSLVTVTDSTVPTPSHLDITADVDVTSSCTSTDTDGISHNYPTDNTTTVYLGICALEKAVENGSITSVGLSNQFPSLGLFVTKINDTTADPSSEYWALYLNGNFAEFGLTSLPVTTGDKIVLERQDFSGNNLGDKVTINIRSLVTNTPTSSGGGGTSSGGGGSSRKEVKKSGSVLGVSTDGTFDAKKALNFLISQQKDNGSFGEELYTDWVAIAIASHEGQNQDIKPIVKLIKYFSENKLEGKLLTDIERRSMALMSLGLNPYNTNGENYIEKIISSFDGTQFGNANEDNDDIFALIVLKNAGWNEDDKIIESSIKFILDRQKDNGSWDESIDMTSAGIVALSNFEKNDQIAQALKEAKNFLKKNHRPDGSWGNNVSSTSWVIGGILGLKEEPSKWKDRDASPLDYLGSHQDTDGGIKKSSTEEVIEVDQNTKNRIWETAYALTAYSQKTWNEIMQKFEKIETSKETTETTAVPPEQAKKVSKKVTGLPTETKKDVNENIKSVSTQSVPDTLPTTKIEVAKKQSWFKKVLNKIFGI